MINRNGTANIFTYFFYQSMNVRQVCDVTNLYYIALGNWAMSELFQFSQNEHELSGNEGHGKNT